MEATYQSLYKEEWSHDKYEEFPTNYIIVHLRYWHSDYVFEYVLEWSVLVDEETVSTGLKAFSGYGNSDSVMIRAAIKKFDELLAAHPAYIPQES